VPETRPDPRPTPDSDDGAWGLSPRELDVLRLVCDGRSNGQIAERLVISTRTVQSHVASLLAKSQARNRTDLAVRALRAGIVPLWPDLRAGQDGHRR
jgi:DNA-binding NarL/FixJ family response regulator